MPAQSVMPASAAVSTPDDAPEVAAAIAVLAERAALLHRGGGAGLLDCFAAIADPRSKRGIRHSLPTILGLSLIHISEPTRPY